jgi:hypothetical protein
MDWNVYSLIQKPVYQALLFLLLTPILIIALRPKSVDTAWLVAAYTFDLFLLVNAALLWFDNSPWRYFFYSIGNTISYLLVVAIVMQGLQRILRLEGSGESAMAFLTLIYQPVALLLVMLIKWIITKWL